MQKVLAMQCDLPARHAIFKILRSLQDLVLGSRSLLLECLRRNLILNHNAAQINLACVMSKNLEARSALVSLSAGDDIS